jgi:hypothetical protein
MLLVDACTTQFEHFSAYCIKGSEIKLLGAVEAVVRSRAGSGLHAVGAHDFRAVFNNEMIACRIVGVFIPEGEERGFESLLKLKVEDKETEGLRGSDVFRRGSQTHVVLTRTHSAR